MIVGIDIGGSTTDAVILENGGLHVVTIEANDPVAAAAGALGKLVADFGIRFPFTPVPGNCPSPR